MTFRHIIDDCFAEGIGPGGLARADYQATLARAAPALDDLRRARDDGSLPLLALPAKRDDLPELEQIAADWRARFRRIVLLGTGGSSLGARALAEIADGPAAGPELVVLDNLDPDSLTPLTEPSALAETGFLVISKSGGTSETLAQALLAVDRTEAALGGDALAKRFLIIVEPGTSPLRRLAERLGTPALDHDSGIGGRYAVLSPVGLLPALILGLDASEVRAGAAAVLEPVLQEVEPAEVPSATGAAIAVALSETRGVSQTVLLAYADRLATFGLWYRQLWAESLGKDGKGTTPIQSLGPVDQHSQLQLYLDGPRDKLYTLLTLPQQGRGPTLAPELAAGIGLEALAGHHVGDLVAAMQRATAETLAKRGRPVRRIELERLDARAMGALFMHFMLETIIAAALLEVDPFDQPAVEEGKILARHYLGEMAKESCGRGAA